MQKIIIALKKHLKFGYVFSAFITERKNEHFIEITNNISLHEIEKHEELIDNQLEAILKTIDSYSDKQLVKIFAKKKTIAEFIKKVTKEDIETRIRPFIEKRLVIIIKKLQKTNVDLYFLKDKNTNLHEEDKILIKPELAKTIFNIERDENGIKYFLSIKHNEKSIKLFQKNGIIISNDPCVLLLENKIYNFKDIDGKKLKPFFSKTEINVSKQSEKKWFEVFGIKALKKYEVNAKGFTIIENKIECKPELVLEKDWKGEYAFVLYFKYGKYKFHSNKAHETKLEFIEDDFSFIKFNRDKLAENEIIESLKEVGLNLQTDNNFKITLKTKRVNEQQSKTIENLNIFIPKFKTLGITFKQDLFKKEYFTQKVSANIKVTKNKDWFDIYGTAKFGDFEIPFIKLKNHILNGKKEYILPDKTIAIIPDEWFAKYSEVFMFAETDKDKFQIKSVHFEAIQKAKIKGIDTEFKKQIKKLLSFKDFEVELPKNIKAELRPYQKEGFKWMYFLQENNFGGCLADDMGLGKTLQTITLLQKTINNRKANPELTKKQKSAQTQLSLFDESVIEKADYQRKTSLIVMPVSLIHNWKNELKKFAPNLKVLQYKGANRQKNIKKFDNYDIILSGYATIRNDIELIKEHDFLYVILDESQYIKNASSKTYQAMLELEAEHRLVLTGTPIENSLSDLWSQMNFINDGMLGNQTFFNELFIRPIERNNDDIQTEKLQKLISPFLLRRTKDEVAKDLPPLTEQTIICKQDDEQKSVYETVKSKVRNKILELIESGEKKNLSVEVLGALMKLRQISNHPVMVDEKYEGQSGKFNEVIRNIENIISENHKVLIFSSFVKHLDLFASYFEDNNIKYSKLTGQTKRREEIITNFQEDEENRIFLISIKSGGTGLNLTQADYVFILDPWWNPAVEKQAVNRAHRIGQNKKVMVYRYISEDTIEQKIAILQNKKSKLAETFINNNNPLKYISEDGIMELFK